MPEQLTKHPEATLLVLRSAGAKCGEGAKPEILVSCPTAKFCKLPGGEICVYGIADAVSMTQFNETDWRALQVLHKETVPAIYTVPFGTLLIAIGISFVAGMLVNGARNGIRRRRQIRRERQGHAP